MLDYVGKIFSRYSARLYRAFGRVCAFPINFSQSAELLSRKIFLNRSTILQSRSVGGSTLRGNRAEASDDKDVRDKMQEASAQQARKFCVNVYRGYAVLIRNCLRAHSRRSTFMQHFYASCLDCFASRIEKGLLFQSESRKFVYPRVTSRGKYNRGRAKMRGFL